MARISLSKMSWEDSSELWMMVVFETIRGREATDSSCNRGVLGERERDKVVSRLGMHFLTIVSGWLNCLRRWQTNGDGGSCPGVAPRKGSHVQTLPPARRVTLGLGQIQLDLAQLGGRTAPEIV